MASAKQGVALRRPPPLQPGSPIWPFSPGSCSVAAEVAAGGAWLQSRGLRLLSATEPAPHLYYAGTDDERALALLAGLQQSGVRALWARRGGSGTARLLSSTEAPLGRALATAPPWLVGFSDVTALHARWQAAGIVSLHAANLANLMAWQPSARDELLSLLGDSPPSLTYEGRVLFAGAPARPVCGTLFGGNLTVLAALAGTGVLPPWQGGIVLLEDVGEAPYRLDRALYQLIAAGHLTGVVGVAIGQLTRCGGASGNDAGEQLALAHLAQTLAPLNVPVLAGLAIGHGPESRAVALGGRATLDPAHATLTVAL